jgi:hypothetical protein
MRFTEGCSEIYDLCFLAGIQQPNALNLDKPDTRRAISTADRN